MKDIEYLVLRNELSLRLDLSMFDIILSLFIKKDSFALVQAGARPADLLHDSLRYEKERAHTYRTRSIAGAGNAGPADSARIGHRSYIFQPYISIDNFMN